MGDCRNLSLRVRGRLRCRIVGFHRRNDFFQRICKSHSARCNGNLTPGNQSLRTLKLDSVNKSTVAGAQIPNFPGSIFEKNLCVTPARSFVGYGNFVGRSSANDQRTPRVQTKNVRPAGSLANNEVSGQIVWLHRGAAEITLELKYFEDSINSTLEQLGICVAQ